MSAPDFRDRLKQAGYRLTPQRELVLRAVEELGHATPDEVLARVQADVSSVNASTVYRTLEMLDALGLVRHLHLTGRAPTYHSQADPHFHLVCRGCQQVTSVPPAVAADFSDLLWRRYRFAPDVGHLTVFGACERCHDDPDRAEGGSDAESAS